MWRLWQHGMASAGQLQHLRVRERAAHQGGPDLAAAVVRKLDELTKQGEGSTQMCPGDLELHTGGGPGHRDDKNGCLQTRAAGPLVAYAGHLTASSDHCL